MLGTESSKMKKLSDCTWGTPSLSVGDWRAVRSSVRSGDRNALSPRWPLHPIPSTVIMGLEAR